MSQNIEKTVREIRNSLMDSEDNIETYGRINEGYCVEFAIRVYEETSNTKVWKADNFHTWIEYDGKYYDAEHPTGVDKPEDLTIFMKCPYSEELVENATVIKD